MYRVAFEDMTFEGCGPGVRHKVHSRDGRWYRLVEYARDMPPHWCERGHLGHIVEGELQIEFATGTWVFRTGDHLDIPPGHADRHRATVLSDKVVALFVEGAPH